MWVQEKKKALREELQAVNNQRDSLRIKLRDLKGKVGSYATVQKIEEKIASLDYRVTHHTLDLKEEKRVWATCHYSLVVSPRLC